MHHYATASQTPTKNPLLSLRYHFNLASCSFLSRTRHWRINQKLSRDRNKQQQFCATSVSHSGQTGLHADVLWVLLNVKNLGFLLWRVISRHLSHIPVRAWNSAVLATQHWEIHGNDQFRILTHQLSSSVATRVDLRTWTDEPETWVKSGKAARQKKRLSKSQPCFFAAVFQRLTTDEWIREAKRN